MNCFTALSPEHKLLILDFQEGCLFLFCIFISTGSYDPVNRTILVNISAGKSNFFPPTIKWRNSNTERAALSFTKSTSSLLRYSNAIHLNPSQCNCLRIRVEEWYEITGSAMGAVTMMNKLLNTDKKRHLFILQGIIEECTKNQKTFRLHEANARG